MNKRKASADRNSKQRTSSRRPSTSSLYSRPNTAHQKLKPEKSPSTQILVTPEPQNLSKTIQVSKAVETCLPKTRFSSQDRCRELRSYSSPRLKYFPAEKIKKFESPPTTPIGALIAQQNPHESGVYYVAGHPEYNNGQGDAATASQSLHQHRPPQQVQSVGQQQVAAHQIAQMNPHSDPTLPQEILNQSHRPFVPHGLRERSPQKTIAGVHNSHSAYHNPTCALTTPQSVAHQAPNHTVSMMDQVGSKPEEPTNVTQQPDYEKQPIGGRNAANYRQMINRQQIQPQSQMSMDPNMSNLTPSNHQQLQNHYSRHGHFSQNPQQVYQQMQQNMQQQMQMQQRAMNYQMQVMGGQGQGSPYGVQYGRYFPGQGMTSPQDVTVNQMKYLRNGQGYSNQVHQRDLDYSINPQNGWAKNNQLGEYSSIKAQLKPYNVEVINNNQPHHGTHPYHHAVHQHRPMYKNPGQDTTIMYHQPGFDQQMSQQPSVENNQVPRNGQKKSLQFTHDMLRDQEKLLNTMKQQGVPLEIMRRQFDTLLNEQRKHLEYLEYLRRQDEEEEVRRVPVNPRRRRNIDEKPEWMAHLTPSRMSYLEMERLREQQKKEQEARLQQQNANEMVNQQPPLQIQNQQISQIQNQQIPQLQNQQIPQLQNQQIPQLQNQQAAPQIQNQQPYQLWQHNWQHPRIPQPCNIYPQPYVISGSANMNQGPMNYRQQQSMPDYQYAHQQHNHQQQQHYQYVPQQNQEQLQQTNGFSGYQEVRQPAEPSSLLKIRQYKNEVRPQKRNNGLQDPEVARRQLEELRANTELRKGLEYLANFAPKKATLRLNGIQDRSETETEIQKRLLVLNTEPAPKKVSANGLENSRNPDNPPPQRLSTMKKLEHEFAKEYPRQREPTPRNCYSVPAERENGTMATEQQPQYLPQQLPVQNSANLISYNDKSPMMARGNVMPFKFDFNHPEHYQQMQQYYQNTRNLTRNNGEGDVGASQRIEMNRKNFERAGGDAYENMNGHMIQEGKIPMQGMHYDQPDIHEARTIGGVRYLARKQDYLPNQQMVAPETLIASRHLQPPIIY